MSGPVKRHRIAISIYRYEDDESQTDREAIVTYELVGTTAWVNVWPHDNLSDQPVKFELKGKGEQAWVRARDDGRGHRRLV